MFCQQPRQTDSGGKGVSRWGLGSSSPGLSWGQEAPAHELQPGCGTLAHLDLRLGCLGGDPAFQSLFFPSLNQLFQISQVLQVSSGTVKSFKLWQKQDHASCQQLEPWGISWLVSPSSLLGSKSAHPGHQLLILQQGGWSSPFLPEFPHLFCQSIYHSLLQESACLSVLHWSVGSSRAGSALSVLTSFEPVLWTQGGRLMLLCEFLYNSGQ